MADLLKGAHIIYLTVVLNDPLFFCCFDDVFIIIFIKTANMEFHIGVFLLHCFCSLQEFIDSFCLHNTGNICKHDFVVCRVSHGNELFQIDTGTGKNVIPEIFDASVNKEPTVLQVLKKDTACGSHPELIKKYKKLLPQTALSQSFPQTGYVCDIGNLQNAAGHTTVNGTFDGIGQNHVRLDLFEQFYIISQQRCIPEDIGTSAVNVCFDMPAAIFLRKLLTFAQNAVWKGGDHIVAICDQPLNQLTTHSENNEATISQYQYSLYHAAQTPVTFTCGLLRHVPLCRFHGNSR